MSQGYVQENSGNRYTVSKTAIAANTALQVETVMDVH
jgi:hypothetical protein